MRPGITGLWQLERTREPGADFQEWIRYDIEYVRRAGLWLDLGRAHEKRPRPPGRSGPRVSARSRSYARRLPDPPLRGGASQQHIAQHIAVILFMARSLP